MTQQRTVGLDIEDIHEDGDDFILVLTGTAGTFEVAIPREFADYPWMVTPEGQLLPPKEGDVRRFPLSFVTKDHHI